MSDRVSHHESYGVITLCHSSGSTNLVGSEVMHQHYFHLTLREAERHVDFGEARFHGNRVLAEVWLTANQLLDLMTQTNRGGGIPCTIRAFNGKMREKPPLEKSRLQEAADYGEEQVSRSIQQNLDCAQSILELCSTLPKGKQDKIRAILRNMNDNHDANAHWYLKRIREATEKSIQIAKTELEAFLNSAVRTLGLRSLQTLSKVLERHKDEET